MRKVFLFASALMLSLSFTSCERIDAGCEGILVNLYGSERGVDDVSMVTGRVFYNPATQEVYEYPTYVQTIDYEPFTINAKDGSEFMVDPNVNLKVKDGAAPKVFRKYRKELTDVINGPVFKYVKDACRIEINKFTTDQIVSNREAVEQAIEKRLSKQNINKPNITNYLSSPTNVDELPVTLGRCPSQASIHCFLISNGVREAFTMALALASASATTIFFFASASAT